MCNNFRILHKWEKWSKPELKAYEREPDLFDSNGFMKFTVGTVPMKPVEFTRHEQYRSCSICGESQMRVVYES